MFKIHKVRITLRPFGKMTTLSFIQKATSGNFSAGAGADRQIMML